MHVLPILLFAWTVLASVAFTQFEKITSAEKVWCFIGMGGQLSGICGNIIDSDSLNLLADDALYFCVATSLFLTNQVLVAYSFLTVAAVYGLFRYHNLCILTGCEWSLMARIAAPVIMIALAIKLFVPRKLITSIRKWMAVSWTS